MALAEKQRERLIKQKGEPKLRLEFDVFDDGHKSMWTHFNHGDNFEEVKKMLIEIKEHISDFIDDENMCPFHGVKKIENSAEKA